MKNNIATPVKDSSSNKKQTVQEQLMQLIQAEKYSDGDKLPSERELSSMFGVSRNVLREAIISMASNGVVEVRDRQGIFVKNVREYGEIDSLRNLQLLPADFIAYQLEVRLIISKPAVQLAAQRRTDDDIRKFRECFTSFLMCPYSTPEEQLQSGKWEALLHHLYTEAAHNPILSRVNENINALVERNNLILHPVLVHESGWISHISQQHKTIMRAIEERNSKLAGDVLTTHMVESVEIMTSKHPDLITSLSHPYWSINND